MVDISLEILQKAFEALKDPALGTFIEEMEAAGKSVVTLGELSSRVGPAVVTQIKNITGATFETVKAWGEFGGMVRDVADAAIGAFGKMTSGIGGLIQDQKNAGLGAEEIAIKLGLVGEVAVGVIPEAVRGMGGLGKAGYDAGQTISEAFSPIGAKLREAGVPKSVIDTFDRIAGAQTRAYGLQKEIIGLAVAQGRLGAVTDKSGEHFRDMNGLMTQMSVLALESAEATGQTVGSMMDLAKALGTIPDALTASVEAGGLYYNQMVLTSQVAAGFGRKQSEVAAQLRDVYTTMGLRGTKAYEQIATLYEAAGDSKLRFEAFNKSVMDIAGSFKMLGDNTAAATNVVKAFDTAFKTSEISPAAMQEVISGLTAGVRDMERGTQAFISAQTGGPGGLAGAFQIELAMQEGRMDEVLEKTMTAMQAQFGGEVLTLKDAASNPALAGEFYKQVQYLTQVAGVAKSDREAYRILEAMQSGVMDILQPGAAEGGEALGKAQMRGAAEQARTTSAVMKLHRELEMMSLTQSNIFGTLNDSLNEQMKMASSMDAMAGMSKGRGLQSFGTTEEVRGKATPGTDLDVMRRWASPEGPIGKVLEVFTKLGKMVETGGLGRIISGRMTKEEREKEAERELAEPVGAGLAPGAIAPPPPPGAGAGVAPFPGGPRPPVGAVPRRGMEFGRIGAAEAFIRGEEIRMPPMDVNHGPIDITVHFPDFDSKVKVVAEGVVERAEKGRTNMGGVGASSR